MNVQPDFLIVGSGGGGGTIAWVLAKAGFKVLILEQGPNFAEEHRDPKIPYDPKVHDENLFRVKKPDPKRRLRGDYNTFALRNQTENDKVEPFDRGWTGSVLGGGSLLWGTWSFRPLPIDFSLKSLFDKQGQDFNEGDDAKKKAYSVVDWPIKYSEMLPYFSVAEALLGVSGDRTLLNNSIKQSPWYQEFSAQYGTEPWFGTEEEWFPSQPFPLGAYPKTPVGQLVANAFDHVKPNGSAAPMYSFPTPMAVVQPGSGEYKTREGIAQALAHANNSLPGDIWKEPAEKIWSEQIRQACTMCGFCGEYLCWGRTGPKWGTQDSTLKELRHLPNVEIVCNAKVIEVNSNPEGTHATGVTYLDLTDKDHPKRVSRSANTVILSCGAVQTARLLLLSGPSAGLGNSSGRVGRYATFHLFGLGYTVTLAEKFDGLLHGEFGPTGNVSTFWSYFIKNKDSAGKEKWVKGGHLTSAAKKNPLEDTIRTAVKNKYGSELIDSLKRHNRTFEIRLTGDDLPSYYNRVTLDKFYVDEYGIPVARITRGLGCNEKFLDDAAKKVMTEVFEFYPDEIFDPDKKLREPREAQVDFVGDHQHGTCRMGNDSKTSVVNRFCRLHDVDNVFVVDSSFMPTGLGLNPMVTVVANALRVGTHIVNSLRRGESLSNLN